MTTDSTDSDFTYDLETMKKAVNSSCRKVPKHAVKSDESFDEWLNNESQTQET